MKKNLRIKITSRSNSEAIAQKLFALLITSTLSSAVFTTHATAQNAGNNVPSSSGAVGQKSFGTGANGPLLANAVAGKLMVKADVGYVLSFAGDWNKSTAEKPSIGGNTSAATGGVGYGASLGWTSKTGFGLSADYLGFNHKWTGLGTDGKGTEYNYDAPYHVMTITPSYRFKLDSADNWGLRVGLGVGFSLSDVSWAQKLPASGAQSKAGTKVAGGAVYKDVNATFGGTNASPTVTLAGTPAVDARCIVGIYTDGQASSSTLALGSVSPNFSMGANECLTNITIGSRLTGGVITDSLIATAINAGKISLVYSDALHTTAAGQAGSPVAYGVWSQVFGANANATGVTALINAGGFESGTKVVMKADTWAGLTSAQQNKLVTAGVVYANNTVPTNNTPASSGGSAKDDAGFVLAPQVALEYDNNLLHADINVKYIHELFNVRYFGSEGSVSGTASSGAITYTSKPGPLALFIGPASASIFNRLM